MRKLLILPFLAACAGSFDTVEPPPRTTAAEIPNVTRDRAIQEIVDARCSREFSCANVGAGRTWRDFDTCKRDARLSMRDTLSGQSCDDGVNAERLASCLADLRNLYCDASDNTVEHYSNCANQRLCR